MFKTVDLSENLLTSVDISEKDEVISRDITGRVVQILFKFQKFSKFVKG